MGHCGRKDEPREEEDLNCQANRDDVGTSGHVFRRLVRDDNGANTLRNKRRHVSCDEYLCKPAGSHKRMSISLDDGDDSPKAMYILAANSVGAISTSTNPATYGPRAYFGLCSIEVARTIYPSNSTTSISPLLRIECNFYSQYPPSTNGMKYHVLDLTSWYQCRSVTTQNMAAAMIAEGNEGSYPYMDNKAA
jgi:hypothetical protein